MNDFIIDTNPLVYIYNDVPELGEKYAEMLDVFARKGMLFIPKIVYGELSLVFKDDEELATFVKDTGLIVGEIERAAYVIAARRWHVYNRRRVLMCHRCGKRMGKQVCGQCGTEIRIRQHILTDFLIGAYALQSRGANLITHDVGYYSTYFPELNIITAESNG
jgi:predicted nucleic acid-binding protein